ncbi:MAG TPA: Rrf2 family transcriptional regulator [Opitutaceae bacterium]|nr:Rrf2 family transcriptional regulator [Opitutaceae bacterium]
MLSLAKTTGYAIAAMSHLDAPGGEPVGLRDIARKAHVPYAYLAKRMPELVAAGLVRSVRGKRGGVLLARPPAEITLLQISEAVEARQWLGRCLLGLVTCSDERACPAHSFWKEARQQIETTLRGTTLADVIAHEQRMAQARAAQ